MVSLLSEGMFLSLIISTMDGFDFFPIALHLLTIQAEKIFMLHEHICGHHKTAYMLSQSLRYIRRRNNVIDNMSFAQFRSSKTGVNELIDNVAMRS